MASDEWVRAKLKELAKRPLPEPGTPEWDYLVKRAQHHCSGTFIIVKGPKKDWPLLS